MTLVMLGTRVTALSFPEVIHVQTMPPWLPADLKVTQAESCEGPEVFHACEISHPFDGEKRTYLQNFPFMPSKFHADY